MKSLFAALAALSIFAFAPEAEARPARGHVVVVRGPAPVVTVGEQKRLAMQRAKLVHLTRAAQRDGVVTGRERAEIRAAKHELRSMGFVFRSS